MNVSSEIKAAYKGSSHAKTLHISFPDLDYDVPDNEVYYESLKLDEAIFDGDSFEVVGCIASKLEVEIRDTGENLKGENIIVSISLDEIEDSDITLFKGYVDTVDREAQKKMQKITAYDALYSKGAIDVADWYNNLSFPITLYDFRNSLFDFIEIEQDDVALPNDSIIINKEYNPNTLKALSIIKALCQINGCFGMMNRAGIFVYRFLDTSGMDGSTDIAEAVPYYRSMEYKDYTVNPIDKLTIRQSSEDAGITIGTGDNQYIIQGNMFTYNLEVSTIHTIATNIYAYLKDIEYIPFEASNNGYPWVEVGDNCVLKYQVYDFDESTSSQDVYKTVRVVALKRSMHGIQNLVDEYSAEGKELQQEFISDISEDIGILEQTIEDIKKHMSTEITTYRNVDAITINDGDTVTIADIVYQADEGNTILFHEEVSLESEATVGSNNTIGDILATVRYYVNGYRMLDHISEGILHEGKNILSLMQFWEAGEAENNRVQAKLTVTGGKISIPRLQASAYITVKQSDYNDVGIKVEGEGPTKRVYHIGERIDFTGLVVKRYSLSESSSVPERDVTSLCVFSPAEWTEVTSTDMITVLVTYSERNEIGELKTYTTEFYLYTQYLTALSVEQHPTKTEYFVGDTLNLTGIKVVAEGIDESTGLSTVKDVTNDCVYSPANGHVFASADEGEITITYTEDTITVDTTEVVSVQEVMITQLKVTTPPNNVSYRAGDTISYAGMVVKAFYNNGTKVDVTNSCTIDPANGSTVTNETPSSALITYISGSDEYSCNLDLNIAQFTEIEVASPPSKTAYKTGETLSLSGISVVGKWSDGHTEDVTANCTFSPADGSTITDESGSIEISYIFQNEEYITTQELTIVTPQGIEVTTMPNKTKYWYGVGEVMDYTGLVVSFLWSDDTSEIVTESCTLQPASGTSVTLDTSVIDVTYVRDGETYETSFNVECNEAEPVLKYLDYNTSGQYIYVNALDTDAIVEDQLQNLVIPVTYTDPESGITFTLVIR